MYEKRKKEKLTVDETRHKKEKRKRECDEEIWQPHTFTGLWERRYEALAIADYSSKHELAVEEEAVSLQPSRLLQAYMGMRKPHFLLAMYWSAGRGIPTTMIGTAKKPTRGNF